MNNLTADLNWYDLYRKVYPSSLLDSSKKLKASNRVGQSMIDGKLKTYRKGYTMSEYTPWVKHLKSSNEVILGDYLSDYMNRQDVRDTFTCQAMHQAGKCAQAHFSTTSNKRHRCGSTPS